MALRAEWGFASAVDTVLLDTGLTGIAYDNAVTLGVDPQFDVVVLSHGHVDHTGGILKFLRGEPEVYLHPEAWKPRYKSGAYIGLPFVRAKLEESAKIIEHRRPVEVKDGVWALGEIPRKWPDNPSGRTPDGDKLVTDFVPDDQSLAVETDDGIALVLGCCHSGLRNTVEYAEEVLDGKVRLILGGTHLIGMDPEGVIETTSWLSGKNSLEVIAPCHCTGFKAKTILQSKLGDRFEFVGVGSSIVL